MPCTVDVATQEILKLAKAADSSGIRTMGVLTKPDLAREETTRAAIIDLVLGKGSTLRLGHFIVMNRSADDKTSTLSDHANAEKAFFANPIWSSIRDRCGVPNLKPRLHELLMHISNQEFPLVKADIEKRLRQNKETLAVMGPSRASQDAQRLYLGRLAARFQEITHAALNGHYTGEKVFKTDPELKLITKIVKLNEVFSNIFWKRGHKQHFGPAWDDGGESPLGKSVDDLPFDIPLEEYSELLDIICPSPYHCPKPSKRPISNLIGEVYESNRGPELGTVSVFAAACPKTLLILSLVQWNHSCHRLRGTVFEMGVVGNCARERNHSVGPRVYPPTPCRIMPRGAGQKESLGYSTCSQVM